MIRLGLVWLLACLSACSLLLPQGRGPEEGDASSTDGDADADADAEADAESDADLPVDPTSCDDGLPGLLFCDGFEDEDLASWPSTSTDGGTVERETVEVLRGAGALRAVTTELGGHASLGSPISLGASETLFLRAHLFVPSASTIDNVSFLQCLEETFPWEHVGLQVYGGGYLGIWVEGPNESAQSSEAVVPRDRWVCIQARIDVAEVGGRVEASVDGTVVATLASTDTLPAGGLELLEAGITFTRQEPTSLLIDEVAAGTEPIPCD